MDAVESDDIWFARYPGRQARIRQPFLGEAKGEFASLGPHNPDRRRLLIWRAPKDSPMPGRLIPIPIILGFDESIENDDKVLLPMLNTIMQDAAAEYGVDPPKMGRA